MGPTASRSWYSGNRTTPKWISLPTSDSDMVLMNQMSGVVYCGCG